MKIFSGWLSNFSFLNQKNFSLKTTFPQSKLLKMWKSFCRKSAVFVNFIVYKPILPTSFQHYQTVWLLKDVFCKKIYFSVFFLYILVFQSESAFFDICFSAPHFLIRKFVKITTIGNYAYFQRCFAFNFLLFAKFVDFAGFFEPLPLLFTATERPIPVLLGFAKDFFPCLAFSRGIYCPLPL